MNKHDLIRLAKQQSNTKVFKQLQKDFKPQYRLEPLSYSELLSKAKQKRIIIMFVCAVLLATTLAILIANLIPYLFR